VGNTQIVKAHTLMHHAHFTKLDAVNTAVSKMNPTFCAIAHPDGDVANCAVSDKIDLANSATVDAISAQEPDLPVSFDTCLYKAKLTAGGPFDLAQYKSACGAERAAYNAAKFDNPMFDTAHCGKFAMHCSTIFIDASASAWCICLSAYACAWARPACLVICVSLFPSTSFLYEAVVCVSVSSSMHTYKINTSMYTNFKKILVGCNNGIGGLHEKFPPPPPLLHPRH